MKIQQSFDEFLSKVSLDKTRRQKIQSAHNTIREILEKDDEIKKIYYETFLQGSYRLGMAVRPQGDGSYDVDVVLSLNLRDFSGKDTGFPSPATVLEWLAKRLKSYPSYADKVKVGKRCVCIEYADGFYLDIIPVHCSGDMDAPVLVPPTWKQSHPKGFKDYCVAKQAVTGDNFYPVTKMLKWWRNIHFGDEASPKSILLTTLVSHHIPQKADSYDEALVLTMEATNAFFAKHFLVPDVFNPSLPEEKLSGSWSLTDYIQFKEKFAAATSIARKAFDSKEEEATVQLWNSKNLFNDTFPKALYALEEEAKALANSMRVGSLFTSPAGIVSSVSSVGSTLIPHTKYHGE